MKKFVLLTVIGLVTVLFSCEENDEWEDVGDTDRVQQALTEAQDCVRYVDTQALPGGDGLSWETAVVSVEDALAIEEGEGDSENPCEVWIKGSSENVELPAEIVAQDKNLQIFDGFSGGEAARPSKKSPLFSKYSADNPVHIANSVGRNIVRMDEDTGYEPVAVGRAHVDLAAQGARHSKLYTPDVTPLGFYTDWSGSDLNAAMTSAVVRLTSNSQSMLLDGNEIDSTAALVLQKNSGNDIYLVKNGGNVGIGTNSPSAMLHIKNPNYAGADASSSGLRFQPNASTSDPNRILGYKGTGLVLSGGEGSATKSHLKLRDSGLYFNTGDWGSDSQKLFVSSWGTMHLQSSWEPFGSGNGTVGLMSIAPSGTGNNQAWLSLCNHALCEYGMTLAYNGPDQLFGIYDNGAADPHLIIKPGSGNVGIGVNTTTLTHKLEVNGTIKAREIIVSTQGWSDFVFDEGYDLMSLYDVEEYIEDNGHLPDVPSAEEVESNGVTLGESQAILLQKIEELTLHVIEQNKRIEHMERNAQSCAAQ